VRLNVPRRGARRTVGRYPYRYPSGGTDPAGNLLTLRRTEHIGGGRRCLSRVAHFESAQQRTYCITFVAICSMLFSDSERLHLRREIFTVICTVRCKSLALKETTPRRSSLCSRV
jgi:hypothetical protein